MHSVVKANLYTDREVTRGPEPPRASAAIQTVPSVVKPKPALATLRRGCTHTN